MVLWLSTIESGFGGGMIREAATKLKTIFRTVEKLSELNIRLLFSSEWVKSRRKGKDHFDRLYNRRPKIIES